MPSPVDILPAAVRYHQAGHLGRAEQGYREVLRQTPGHPDALRLLGILLCQSRRHEEGLRLLRQAAKLQKNNPIPLIDLGQALADKGDFQDAIETLRKATRIAPSNPIAWGGLGMAQFRAGRTAEAIKALRKATALKPDHADLHIALGNAQRQLGYLDQAMAAFQRAVALRPDYAEVFTNLGNIAIELGNFDDAIAHHRRAVELKPGLAWAYHNLGCAYQTARRYEDAAQTFREALKRQPENVDSLLALASCLNELRRREECLDILSRVQSLRPGDKTATQMHVLILRDLGRPVAEFDRLVDGLPDPAARTEARAALADVLETMNMVEEAKTAADRALAHDPAHLLANVVAARLDRRVGRTAEARSRLDALVARGGRLSAAAYTVLGQACDRLKDFDAAFAAFSAAKRVTREEFGEDIGNWQEQFLDHIRAYRAWYTADKVARWAAEDRRDPRDNPIFFVGFPRSGTTLFEQMLDSHPNLVTTGESQILGRLLLIAPSLVHRSEQPPELLDHLGTDEVASLADWYSRESARTCGIAPGSKRVVDKMPLNIIEIGFIRRIFPRAPIIVALRDPRDVILSCFMQNFRINRAMAHFLSIEGTARLYAETMGLWLHYRADPGINAVEYRYEDLIADVEGVTRRVFERLGEPWDDRVLNYRRRASERFVSTPSYADVSAPIYDRSIGRWRNYRRHLEPALPILAPFVRVFGYDEN